jgi:hypothetical protein
MSISELGDDELWHVLSTVCCSDLDATKIQPPLQERASMVYDPQLVTSTVEISLLWSVCKRWTAIVDMHLPLKMRRLIKLLVNPVKRHVMTETERYCLYMQMYAVLPSVCKLIRAHGPCSELTRSSSSVIFYPEAQHMVHSMLRKANSVRTKAGRIYMANLHRVASDNIYYSVLSAFKGTAGMEERLKQIQCYAWCSSMKIGDNTDTVLQLTRSVEIARRLQAHPALCKCVSRCVQTGNYSPLHPVVIKEINRVFHQPSTGRRILPMTFGMPGMGNGSLKVFSKLFRE